MKLPKNNQKGVIALAIPLTLAILGLLGTGVFASVERSNQNQLVKTEVKEEVASIQTKLQDYFSKNHNYPIAHNQNENGHQVIIIALNLSGQEQANLAGISYWSDGNIYNIRYFDNRQEVVVFNP